MNKAVAGGFILCAGAFLVVDQVIQRKRLETEEQIKKKNEMKSWGREFKRQETNPSPLPSDQLHSMLEDLKHKSSKEKLETAYDAAIQTHEIGFPQSKKK